MSRGHWMGWAALSLALGCGAQPMNDGSGESGASEGSGATEGSGSSGEPEVSAFEALDEEYAACGPLYDPLCVNLECGVDEVSSHYVAMLLAEIEDAGLGNSIRVSGADLYPDTNSFLYELQAQVDWYRYWTPSQIRTTDPELEIRAKFRKDVEDLAAAMPASIIARSEVTRLASECDGIVFTLCEGHTGPGHIHILRETGDPCAGGSTDEFSVDLQTGESVCTLDAPTSCGAP